MPAKYIRLVPDCHWNDP